MSDRFVETGENLVVDKADSFIESTGPYEVVENNDGEWWVVDSGGNVVGEWDTEEEALEDAETMQESDDAA